jgi:tetratricopeptide (TPR) repeat protein
MRKKHGITGVSLRLGILAGLLGLTAFLYAVFFMGAPFWGERDHAARFQKALREYDALFSASISVSKNENDLRNYALLERRLKAIEKLNGLNGKAAFSTLQTTLSLLKRERVFARYDTHFRERYEKNLRAATEKYPETVPLRALSLEHTLKNGLPTIEDALKLSEGRGGHFAETALSALAQSSDIGGVKREHLLVDAALLSVVTGTEYRDTNAMLYPLDVPQAVSVNTSRFAAEYAFDAGDFPLASRLFAALPDDNALERAGDARYLGGDTDGARELWLLSSNLSSNAASNANSLYNYASLSEDPAEQMSVLEKLLARNTDAPATLGTDVPPADISSIDTPFCAGLVLYTRLLSEERAVAMLGTSPYTAQTPLLDLELWRRTEENYTPGRALAEMWLLTSRHIKAPLIYEYAAWYFGRERQYEELALLLKNAALQGVDSGMLQYWRVMLDTQTGDNKQCRESLSALFDETEGAWYIAANIGRLYEAERSWKNAVDRYYTALANAEENRDKSRILQRIAACLTAQGRNSEARAALEEAVSLDPANLNARAAMNR